MPLKPKVFMSKTASILPAALMLLLTSFDSFSATTCRSAEAASAGAESGYQYEVNTINQQAENSKTSSEIIGKCISGITGVNLSVPYPDLSDVWKQVVNKVCQTASQSISKATNEAVGDVNAEISGLMEKINVPSSIGKSLTPSVGRPVGSSADNTGSASVSTNPTTPSVADSVDYNKLW